MQLGAARIVTGQRILFGTKRVGSLPLSTSQKRRIHNIAISSLGGLTAHTIGSGGNNIDTITTPCRTTTSMSHRTFSRRTIATTTATTTAALILACSSSSWWTSGIVAHAFATNTSLEPPPSFLTQHYHHHRPRFMTTTTALHNSASSNSPSETTTVDKYSKKTMKSDDTDPLASIRAALENSWLAQLSPETPENLAKSLQRAGIATHNNNDNRHKRPVLNGHYVKVQPTGLLEPRLVLTSPSVAQDLLGLSEQAVDSDDFLQWVSGNLALGDSWATPYALSIMGTRYTHNCPYGDGTGYGDGRAIR